MQRITVKEHVRICPICKCSMDGAFFTSGPLISLALCTACPCFLSWPRDNPPGVLLGPHGLAPPIDH